MLRIGIIGAENTHCAAISGLCNVQKRVAARVTVIWGERPKFAKAAAVAGNVPSIVRDWRDMLGQVDGVMIDHRHPKHHAEVATFFVENGVPCFVDKPFTFTLAEGRRLCALARKKKVPITSFSVIPLQKNFAKFKKNVGKLEEVSHLVTTGPVDLKSKYGGIFFYGIHQVDAIIDLFGTEIHSVHVRRHGKEGVATLVYKDGPIVTMNCVAKHASFHWMAVGDNKVIQWDHTPDSNAYLHGAKTFVRMFRTGEMPFSFERMLAPVATLEAMAKSLKTGKSVKIAKLS